MIEKLLAKKKKDGKELDPLYKSSKMDSLKELRDAMADMMKDDLHPDNMAHMKKVEVAAPDKAGLAKGLEKAHQLVADGGASPLDGMGDMGDEHDEDDEDEEDEEGDEAGKDDEDEHDEDMAEGGDEGHESGEKLIADQIQHEAAEGELSDEEIEQLEMLLAKLKKSKLG